MSSKDRILIAGIGGASLGTEVQKCLHSAGKYEIFGCDISPYAFGHYQEGFQDTFLVNPANYVPEVAAICRENSIHAIVPGGEEPLRLLTEGHEVFRAAGIPIAANSPAVTRLCSDKANFCAFANQAGFTIPRSVAITCIEQMPEFTYPCVVKATTGTGGSSFVFLAANASEAKLYASYILANRSAALLQEYIPEDEGEYTIGVLSLPDGSVAGSVAMRRFFNAKLSVMNKSRLGLISSGYSQGLIDDFPELRAQAEKIAGQLGSVGPINVQARVRNGLLIPFEVNPRFSASTYLRALAGFNEIDIYLQTILHGVAPRPCTVNPGYYLRSLSEVRVSKTEIIT